MAAIPLTDADLDRMAAWVRIRDEQGRAAADAAVPVLPLPTAPEGR